MRTSIQTIALVSTVFAAGCSPTAEPSGVNDNVVPATSGTLTADTTGGVPSTSDTTGGVPSTSDTTGGVPSTSDTTSGAPSTSPGTTTGTTPTAEPPGPAACSNPDKTKLVINDTGWVPRDCNNFGIQGAWYCYDDGVNPSGCVAETTPWNATRKGMCLKGSTSAADGAWGAGIGLSLNETGKVGDMASVKSAYDAAAAGVTGFKITIEGNTGGNEIRVAFKVNDVDDVAPFDAVPGADTYDILIKNAEVPTAWDVPNAGALVDPASILDLQIQIAGGTAADYDFCITDISPITDGTGPGPVGMLANYGQQLCGQYDKINIGPYTIHNNRYNGNSHCVQAMFDNGNTGGFKLSSVNANITLDASPPGSYPALVYGWHVDGQFYGGYGEAKQLNAITSIPSKMSVTVPGAGNRYNTAYDNWIATDARPGGTDGILEQMIWLNKQDTTPIGSMVGSAMLAGTSWEVWYGNHDGFNTVSYVRATNTDSIEFDLKEFMNHTVQEGYAKPTDHLLGIQAGFEIWRSTSNFSVNSFSVSVN